MKKFTSILLLILFFSCSQKSENNLPRLIVPEAENVVEVNTKEMISFFMYNYLASNFNTDQSPQKINFDPSTKFDKFYTRIDFDTIIPKYNIEVFVDTSYTFTQKGFSYKTTPFPDNVIVDGMINGEIPTEYQYNLAGKELEQYYKNNNGSKDLVKCYPLLMLNKSKDTILTRFKFIQEAKDQNGNWKPIENYYNFGGCGNPEMIYYKVISKNYILYPIIKYKGDFNTKLRVKAYNKGNIYYSNEFTGHINISQFDISPFRKMFNKMNPNNDFEESSKFFFLNN